MARRHRDAIIPQGLRNRGLARCTIRYKCLPGLQTVCPILPSRPALEVSGVSCDAPQEAEDVSQHRRTLMRRTCDRSVAQTLLGLVLLVSALVQPSWAARRSAAQERATIGTGSGDEQDVDDGTRAERGDRGRVPIPTVMGAKTSFGGNEVIVVMSRATGAKARFAYRLLATSRTSTMQKELQAAADAGSTIAVKPYLKPRWVATRSS